MEHTPGATRPLVFLAAALGVGTGLGLGLPGFPAGPAPLVTACLLATALTAGARCGRVPPWCGAVLLCAFARGRGLAPPTPGAEPVAAERAHALRAETLVGRWRSGPGGGGWLQPYAGEPRRPGHALLLEPELVAPPEGTPVALLPGSEVVPLPRGPVPAHRSRGAGFAARSAVAADELVCLGEAPASAAEDWLERHLEPLRALRRRLGARAASVEGPVAAGLLRALAVGERDGLTAARVELFARTGTSHLLALSGWHLGLFTALVALPLSSTLARRFGSRARVLVRALLALAFAGMAGGAKPVLRAALAFVLGALVCWRGRDPRAPPRRPDGLSFLSAAFALECLLDPGGLRSLAVQLSYAATLGILVGTGPIAALLAVRAAPRTETWGALLLARTTLWMRTGLAASLAAVLATLPVVWSVFGEVAPAGALLTLLALPAFAAVSILAWTAALVPWAGLRAPAEGAARVLESVLVWGDRLPATPLLLPPRPLALLVLAAACALAAPARPRLRAPAALLWGVLLLPWSAAPRGLELHALDVGHGTAVALRAPGLPALVFDAGSRDRRSVASEALLPLLAAWEAGDVEIVLSHADLDHASGLERLVERVPVRAWRGAPPGEALAPDRFPSRAPPAQRPVRLPHGLVPEDLAPGRLAWRPGAPELGLALLRGAAGGGNEGSRALEVSWRGQRILLAGDAEDAGLAGLPLAEGPLRLLLAPHHGSDARGLAPLLARTPPAEVWISAATRPAIAAELDRRGLAWRWTGREGPLALVLP